MLIRIFTRNQWLINPKQSDALIPAAGAHRHVKCVLTEEEARKFCKEQNAHRPQSWLRLGRKYEFERA